ncbi:MAG: RnfABCDGE type electron transport complex subunit D [bacterium]|nr:RnfABCDGE type electron transport complex subunit D [bacterium]MDD5354768.1 RnfABCDGE type electron transport complex subunit D [bacterium]MDD5756972.1 RnfABCDGE type electron transport complex subunit D [bacterium]
MAPYIVSTSPHLKNTETISKVMRDVLIALAPAAIAAVYFFGLPALWLMLVSIASAIAAEFISEKIMKRDVTISDGSAAITGLLLAMVCPPGIPLWIIAIGAAVSIVLVKQVFGGLGYNPFNPALAGRAILMASWPVAMTTWIMPFDAITTATPLAIAKFNLPQSLPSYWNMFIGNRAGSLGETSAAALLLGAVYLLYKKQISWHIPVSFIASVGLLSGIMGKDPLFNILAGGLLLGAFFMATDMVTSPMTGKGKIIFGGGCGILTVLIRYKGGFPEGVCYSILIFNMLTPLIDKYTMPQKFGKVQ